MTGAKKGRREGAQTERSTVLVGGMGMLGKTQVTHRWSDDSVWRHVGGGGVGSEAGCPLWKKIRRQEEWEGWVK